MGCWSEGGRAHGEIDGGREWEARTVAREDREKERWSECGVGSLNSESEECRVIKEKGGSAGKEIKGWKKRRVRGRKGWCCI